MLVLYLTLRLSPLRLFLCGSRNCSTYMASDSDSDEDFVTYGTPLEPLEEGWAPSTFVSSRQQKAEKHHARPEDFMDEEDFSEHGIAPREITTSQEFSSSRRDEAREKARAVHAQSALIPGDTLLEELISPARSSIGVELLRKMGWKEGQGVGPRVKRKPRRQQTDDGAKVYGCTQQPAGSEDSEDDSDDFAPENVTFAPKDVTPVDFNPRLGVQGLGYSGLDPGLALLGQRASEHIDLFTPQSETRSRLFGDTQRRSRRGGVAGQAFGVGALEDDDEDVYHRDSMSRYDTVLGGEEPGDGLYGWTAPQQYTKTKDRSRDASYLGKILEGFTLSQRPAEEKTIFPPPILPRDYRPVRRFQPSLGISGLSGVSPALAEALRVSRGHMVKEEPQQGGRHQLDSGQRRPCWERTPCKVGGPSSVLELLRPEDRERLLNLRNASHCPSNQTPTTESRDVLRPGGSLSRSLPGLLPGSSTPNSTVSSALERQRQQQQQQQQQEALAAWKGVQTSQTFRPFEKTPSKQARYELYLSRLRQGDKDALEQSLDPGMTEWERSREREEFVRASILYRPTSSSLSSRFTRAKQQEDEDTVEVTQDQEGDMDDKQAAVKMKMFGKLTRETLEWHPDKLLCKRFNVPDPYPGSGLVGLPKPLEPVKKSRWDISDQQQQQQGEEKKKSDALSDLLSSVREQTETKHDQGSTAAPPAPTCSRDQSQAQTQSAGQLNSDKRKESDEEEKEEEEEEESRPPMDLFKAIFASSSDDKSSSSEGESEEEEEEDTKEEKGKMEPQAVKLFNISNVTSTTSVTIVTSSSTITSSTSTPHQLAAVASSQEEFGPKLPPPSAALKGPPPSAPPKKKHKKHKHKAKQEKKNKREESDSSSEDRNEDGDGGDEQGLTVELLKRLKSARSHQTR
ncbi:hypothetical protein INR49_028727 [Caranx melampygus]|nr:hypothetical protein INR49_028727 [Caranx melampygus]